jgi:hypothetical protein
MEDGIIVGLDAVINVVLLESITQHQSPLGYIQLNGVPGILLGSVISEGGSHGVGCV